MNASALSAALNTPVELARTAFRRDTKKYPRAADQMRIPTMKSVTLSEPEIPVAGTSERYTPEIGVPRLLSRITVTAPVDPPVTFIEHEAEIC